MRAAVTLTIALAMCACTPGNKTSRGSQVIDGVHFTRVEVRKMADFSTPRCAHLMYMSGDEIVVFGGHTTGFIPTPTAEWFDGRQWNEVPMTYTHDGAFMAPLSDGSILVGGGSGDSFGIGQSWGVDIYHPGSHSFEPAGILDRKRAYASALTLAGDTVIVSGNWYAEDAIEMYVPGEGFSFVKDVSERRCLPHIRQSAPGEVLIFGRYEEDETKDQYLGIVDRLNGEPFEPQVLKEWKTLGCSGMVPSSLCSINDFTYLIPCKKREETRLGILKVAGEQFSLLQTDHDIPLHGLNGEIIYYGGEFIVKRSDRKAYLPGISSGGNIYIVEINYDAALDGGKATLGVYYAFPDTPAGQNFGLALSPQGNLMLTGGFLNDNFHPLSSTFLLILNAESESHSSLWIILGILVVLLLAAIPIILRLRKEEPAIQEDEEKEETEEEGKDLMSRITEMMEKEELYRIKELRINDLANRLGTNTTYVSACINGQTGQSFNSFITAYRIHHAQQLLKTHPEMLMVQIADESGFTNERSFFRNFKAVTGLTPSEWKEKN